MQQSGHKNMNPDTNLNDEQKTYSDLEKIGGEFKLNIDQVGELYVEISKVISGISKSTDLSKNITSALEIDTTTAQKVTERVNATVLSTVKNNLKIQTPTPTISSIERAGNFTIENEQSYKEVPNYGAAVSMKPTTQESRPVQAPIRPPIQPPSKPLGQGAQQTQSKESLVDQLMRASTPDPYREATK